MSASAAPGSGHAGLVRIQSAHLPGYNHALASSIRDGPIHNRALVFTALGRQIRKGGAAEKEQVMDQTRGREKTVGTAQGKVLLVWGTDDRVVPYRYAERVRVLVGEETARLVTLEGAGHDLTVKRAGEVAEELVRG